MEIRPEMSKKRSCCCDPVPKEKKKRKRANKEKEQAAEVTKAIGGKRHKPEDDEVVLLDAGSSKKERRKHEEKKNKEEEDRRPKPDEEPPNNGGGGGRKKVVKWRLSEKLLNFIRTREAMGHFATRPPMIRSKMAKLLFVDDPQLRREVAAEFLDNMEFDSYVLYQYRTKGYFEIREEVDIDDNEDAVPEIRYFVSDYESSD